MNWFQHKTNARHDPKLAALIQEHGASAYAVYFAILEMIGETMNEECSLEHGVDILARDLRLRPLLVKNFIVSAVKLNLLSEKNGQISNKKILKYCGNYERRVRTLDVETTDTRRTVSVKLPIEEKRREVEENKKEIKEKQTTSLSDSSSPQAAFVDWFKVQYQNRFKKPYVDSKPDYINAANIIKKLGDLSKIQALLFAGWNTPDEKNGFSMAKVCMTVSGFCSVINRIQLEPVKKKTLFELEQESKNALSI